jgi:copper homeostasis protein CutC
MIDRLLVSGDAASLTRLAREAQPEIEVIAGGGLTEARIAQLARATPVREFHCGSAARENGRVRAGKVRALVQAANRVV